MKVILVQKVERLGESGQQVEVADGYARNFLFPRQLAVPATPGHVKSLAQLTAQSRNRDERAKGEATALAERLATIQLTLKRRAAAEAPPTPGESASPEEAPITLPAGGVARPARLFGSVTNQDLSEALAARGLTIEKKKILLAEPIKALGVYRIPVRLHPEVLTEMTVSVEREA